MRDRLQIGDSSFDDWLREGALLGRVLCANGRYGIMRQHWLYCMALWDVVRSTRWYPWLWVMDRFQLMDGFVEYDWRWHGNDDGMLVLILLRVVRYTDQGNYRCSWHARLCGNAVAIRGNGLSSRVYW